MLLVVFLGFQGFTGPSSVAIILIPHIHLTIYNHILLAKQEREQARTNTFQISLIHSFFPIIFFPAQIKTKTKHHHHGLQQDSILHLHPLSPRLLLHPSPSSRPTRHPTNHARLPRRHRLLIPQPHPILHLRRANRTRPNHRPRMARQPRRLRLRARPLPRGALRLHLPTSQLAQIRALYRLRRQKQRHCHAAGWVVFGGE